MNLQKEFRKKLFQFHQFWNVTYIEYYKDGTHKTFFTIIKAKSCSLAKKIVSQKIAEDEPFTKVKFLQVNMFHKNFRSKHFGTMNTKKWENIRNAAFPNIANTLYKKHADHLDGLQEVRRKNLELQNSKRGPDNQIGFKKGKENWSHINRSKEALPKEERSGKIWNGGAWVDWDFQDMESTKNSIINALILNNNVRMKAADYLGINRQTLSKKMQRISDIDWNEEYPPPKPFENVNRTVSPEKRIILSERMKKNMAERKLRGIKPFDHLSEEQLNAARKKAQATAAKRRQKNIIKNIPIIKKALRDNNNIRNRAASSLKKSYKWLTYWMDSSSHIIDWEKQYPSPSPNAKK